MLSRGLERIDHLIRSNSNRVTCECSYRTGMSEKANSNKSQKRGAENLSSDEDFSAQNPEKRHEGHKTPPTAKMASNTIPDWPPLSASASGEGDDVVVGSDETSSTSGPPPFIAPGEANLKEVCEQMSQELGATKAPDDGKAGTFAAAAKKSKKLYPYTVFIVAGENEDRPLIHRHYTAFEEFIFQKGIKLTFEENENLKIEWMSFHGSYGVAVCGDKPTGNWVKNCAQIFKFKERSTRAYFPWQRAESVL